MDCSSEDIPPGPPPFPPPPGYQFTYQHPQHPLNQPNVYYHLYHPHLSHYPVEGSSSAQSNTRCPQIQFHHTFAAEPSTSSGLAPLGPSQQNASFASVSHTNASSQKCSAPNNFGTTASKHVRQLNTENTGPAVSEHTNSQHDQREVSTPHGMPLPPASQPLQSLPNNVSHVSGVGPFTPPINVPNT
ncbi:hypothetical protein B0H34DRAFT_793331 [Crassisporium funariophilum]|nr:hypothetical protein B0H34DRAFT_793331 [Crassisporium funariophilum]